MIGRCMIRQDPSIPQYWERTYELERVREGQENLAPADTGIEGVDRSW